jgi:chromosome segregation ATPase
MENLRKKYETKIQNTLEGHSSKLEQAEDRISELEDEIEIKVKTEELLVKQLKTCERNMQELPDSIKRQNLRIVGKQKELVIYLTKKTTENFQNLEKAMPIQ